MNGESKLLAAPTAVMCGSGPLTCPPPPRTHLAMCSRELPPEPPARRPTAEESIVVRRWLESQPQPIRDAMRERDAGYRRVSIFLALLAYAFGLYVGNVQL